MVCERVAFSVQSAAYLPHLRSSLVAKYRLLHAATLAQLDELQRRACELRLPLRLQKVAAVAIKSYNPAFQDDFQPYKNMDPDRERSEMRKLKREYKGASKAAHAARAACAEGADAEALAAGAISELEARLAEQRSGLDAATREADAALQRRVADRSCRSRRVGVGSAAARGAARVAAGGAAGA